MQKKIIEKYTMLLNQIREIIDKTPPDNLYLQSDKYKPATICHPVWTLGHLAGSSQGMGGEMFMEPWLEKGWEEKYGQFSDPVSDKTFYHQKEYLLQQLAISEKRLSDKIFSLSTKELEEPIPDIRYHKKYPTLAHVLCHILIGHVSEHISMLLLWEHFVK